MLALLIKNDMTLEEGSKILKAIKELKIILVKGQDFPNAALMRDMEKHYMDKKLEP